MTFMGGFLILAAQTCFLGQAAAPKCSGFFVTNAGIYAKPTAASGESHFRAIVDWGIMINSSPHHAVGASFFVTLDEDEFTAGPVIRYRRWFDSTRSLDIAVGTPLTRDELRPGSILALIKYNPEEWVGFGLRPEYVRRQVFTCGPGPVPCTSRIATSARVYAGIEVGSLPGLTLTVLGLGALVFIYIAVANSD